MNPRLEGRDEELACDAPNSFLISLMPPESRGHSQENESLAHWAALARARKSLAAACCFTGLTRGTGTFSVSLLRAACCTCCTCCICMLLRRERGRDGRAPLPVEIDDVLFVDVLLFFRRRVRAGDIEVPVLHEIEIGVAAAWLAAAGEFGMAFGKLRGSLVLRRLLGALGAILEISRLAAPPLRLRARRRRQHDACGDRGDQPWRAARHHHRGFSQNMIQVGISRHNFHRLSPLLIGLSPRNRTILGRASRSVTPP